METNPVTLTAKDFASAAEVKWCPGCGDYSILKQVQTVLADSKAVKEKTVFVSGIGCSSRFPYYMSTYGLHTIHGRPTAIATGLKLARPDLDVWVITGDGDALSIGGNHFIHILRRNPDLKILLFNNQIYGLTKGQYSPTSELGKVTKSSPYGSVDFPMNPQALALGAGATFVARTMDRDPLHLRSTIHRAQEHRGASLVEIYQNCNVFNDGAFELYTEKSSKKKETLFVEHGKPLIFGDQNELGIRIEGFRPVVVNLNEGFSAQDLWIHDEHDPIKAVMLARLKEFETEGVHFPQPFGVFYVQQRPSFENTVRAQIEAATAAKGKGDIKRLLMGRQTWVVG
jgi:2-oxoglutarate/2-oxoacid ferredoxin oxidoreductase subunit beta